MKKVIKIEVDCANCANKVENAVNELEGVECNVSFMSQKMTIKADEEKMDDVLKAVVEKVKKVDPDTVLYLDD